MADFSTGETCSGYYKFVFVIEYVMLCFGQQLVVNGKAIPLQDWTGPAGSRRLRHPDFKTVGT